MKVSANYKTELMSVNCLGAWSTQVTDDAHILIQWICEAPEDGELIGYWSTAEQARTDKLCSAGVYSLRQPIADRS